MTTLGILLIDFYLSGILSLPASNKEIAAELLLTFSTSGGIKNIYILSSKGQLMETIIER